MWANSYEYRHSSVGSLTTDYTLNSHRLRILNLKYIQGEVEEVHVVGADGDVQKEAVCTRDHSDIPGIAVLRCRLGLKRLQDTKIQAQMYYVVRELRTFFSDVSSSITVERNNLMKRAD